jgi:hypothetical protein
MESLTMEIFLQAKRIVDTICSDCYPLTNMITDSTLVKKKLTRMCRSKKRRVKKKWLGNDRNYTSIPDESIYMFGGTYICHPQNTQVLHAAVTAQKEENG